MTFVRVNPPGWGVGDKLKSPQINQLDIDHSNALDKTTAGDILSGVVSVASTGQVALGYPDGVMAYAASAIVSAAGAGIQTQAQGGLSLAGGANDWPVFSVAGSTSLAPRSRTIWIPGDRVAGMTDVPVIAASAPTDQYDPSPPSTGSAVSPLKVGGGFFTQVVSGASNTNAYAYYLPIDQPHNGAILSAASLKLFCAPTRSNLPTVLPSFGLFRSDTSGNVVALVSSGSQYSPDGSTTIAAYKAVHSITYTPNANNVIDSSQYRYFAIILDECGTSNTDNATTYLGIQIVYSGIANMAFP